MAIVKKSDFKEKYRNIKQSSKSNIIKVEQGHELVRIKLKLCLNYRPGQSVKN